MLLSASQCYGSLKGSHLAVNQVMTLISDLIRHWSPYLQCMWAPFATPCLLWIIAYSPSSSAAWQRHKESGSSMLWAYPLDDRQSCGSHQTSPFGWPLWSNSATRQAGVWSESCDSKRMLVHSDRILAIPDWLSADWVVFIPVHRHSHHLPLQTMEAKLNSKKGIKMEWKHVYNGCYLSRGRDTCHLISVSIGVASIGITCVSTKVDVGCVSIASIGIASVGMYIAPLGHFSKSVGCTFASWPSEIGVALVTVTIGVSGPTICDMEPFLGCATGMWLVIPRHMLRHSYT